MPCLSGLCPVRRLHGPIVPTARLPGRVAATYPRPVPASRPSDGPVSGVLLTPGAGSDRDHPGLVALEERLSPLPVERIDFGYRTAGRRFPDRAPVLLGEVRDGVARMADERGVDPARLVLGGRSMGGRMCSMAVAEGLYDELRAAGVDVLLDDRDGRPGVKFADAELVGIPLRVTIGPRGLESGALEVTTRADGERTDVPVDQVATHVVDAVTAGRVGGR